MTLTDRGWIGRDMFVKRGELKSLKNWWHPPAVPEQTKPDPALYHREDHAPTLAQSAARQSHNLKVVSSSLTGGTFLHLHNFFIPPNLL